MLRVAQRLALTTGAAALGAFGLTTVTANGALAEFEIQESGVEKGEKECEYRGAVHWGFPRKEREEAEEENETAEADDDEADDDEADGDGDNDDDAAEADGDNDNDDDAAEADEGEEEEEVGALEEEEEGEFLRQSHDAECEYGITERFMGSVTLSADEPLEDDFDLSSVELEAQYELVERQGNGLGLAFIGAYGFATRGGEADEIEFGPIVELGSGGFLLTTNTFFSSQVGEHRETDGLGFEYGWRAQQKIARKWAIAAEMFGEIEDLSNAGSFDDQPHSLGPTLLYVPNGDDDGGGDDDDNGNGRMGPKPAEMEVSFNLGVQFGLTDATSDTALKFQGSIGF
jgi:hypothetical protein